MFEFEYENFLAMGYPSCKTSLELPESLPCSMETGLKRGKRFLEMNCSAAYGYPEEAYHTRDMTRLVVGMIPTSFASGFCLGFFKDLDIHPSVIDALVKVVQESRRPSGLWNFFLDVPDASRDLLPDDIDDTGCFSVALLGLNKMSVEEGRSIADKILQNVRVGPHGGMDTWITAKSNEHQENVIMMPRMVKKVREDIGCILNALWFMASIGYDIDPRAISSIHCVEIFLDEHLKDVEKVLKHFMYYYTDRYVLYYFLARFMEKSAYARKLFGAKFARHIKNTILGMGIHGTHALQLASCVMAAIKLNLHKDGGQKLIPMGDDEVRSVRVKIMELVKALITLQNKDGSFPVWKVYRWNHMGHYGGSKVVSTTFALSAIKMVKTEIMEECEKLTPDHLTIY